MQDFEAEQLTLKVMRIILEEVNGYEPEEIKSKKMAEDCASSDLYQRTFELFKKIKTRKKLRKSASAGNGL